MHLVVSIFKKLFFSEQKERFYYIHEEIRFEHEAENHKVSFLTSYKNVG